VPRPAGPLEFLGPYQGSGLVDPPYLIRLDGSRMVQVSHLLYLVAAAADGTRDAEQMARAVSTGFGRAVSAEGVAYLVEHKLVPLGVLAGASQPSAPAGSLLGLTGRARVIPAAVVGRLASRLLVLFRPLVSAGVVGAFAGFDAWLFGVRWSGTGLGEALVDPAVVFGVLALAFLSLGVHELGHATACRYGGAAPGPIGVGLYLVWPAFFTDVTDSYRLDRAGRLRTDLGGLYFNAVLVLVCGAAYGATGAEFLLVAIVVMHLQMAMQLLPFVRLDGYYLLTDLTGVPDLFARVRPVLAGLRRPGRIDPRMADLRPGVRAVVTGWVVITLPALAVALGYLVVHLPNSATVAAESVVIVVRAMGAAVHGGRIVTAVVAGAQAVLLLLPVVGVVLLLARVSMRLATAARRPGRPRQPAPPVDRSAPGAAGAVDGVAGELAALRSECLRLAASEVALRRQLAAAEARRRVLVLQRPWVGWPVGPCSAWPRGD